MTTSVSRPAAGAALPLGLVGRLTERDRAICRLLWTHRVLTTEQLAAVFFDSRVSAQHRLVTLYRLGVLERFRALRPVGSESWRYTLGPAGAALVAAERGEEPPRPAALRAQVTRLAAGPRTAHLLGVNGFFCSLAAYARRHGDCVLDQWWSERRAAAEWGDLVRPDAYGQWAEGASGVGFFLEYDTGSETLGRLVAKLSGYADVAAAEGIARPVCFWLARPGREAELHRVLGRPPVPVATAVAGTGACPAEAVWWPVGCTQFRRRLAELGAAP